MLAEAVRCISLWLQVVDKTTRNALDILDWIGLKHIGTVAAKWLVLASPAEWRHGRLMAQPARPAVVAQLPAGECPACSCSAAVGMGVCDVCNYAVPRVAVAAADVVKGQPGPLMRETALICPEIHGETGKRRTPAYA